MTSITIDRFEKEISEIAERMMSGKDLKDHGFEHVKRVVEYGKKIIEEEEIPEKHLFDISAALYCHDIGRVDDSKDDEHGIRGAEIFEKEIFPLYKFLDLETILFTIRNHQNYVPDKGKYPVVENYNVTSDVNLIIPMVMWDADRLDLPRIEKFKGNIDPNYLNTRYAKEFANSKEHLKLYD
jgi:hypothetical protein